MQIYRKLPRLEPGDIFSTPGRGPAGWANSRLTTPYTEEFHFGLLLTRHRNQHDWLTMESTAGGVRPGLLSEYLDEKRVIIYRVNAPQEVRHGAPWALLDYYDIKYDYGVFLKFIAAGLIAWINHLLAFEKPRALTPEDLGRFYGENWDSEMICTEAVWAGYNLMGWDILLDGHIRKMEKYAWQAARLQLLSMPDPPVIPPIPAAYKEAELHGAMTEIYRNEDTVAVSDAELIEMPPCLRDTTA